MKASSLRLVLATSVAALITAPSAKAVIYYWDTDDVTAGFGNTAGTWGSSPFWSTTADGTGTAANTATTNADVVNFGTNVLALGSTASTVGVDAGGVTVNGITFGSAQTTPVTLSGGGGSITLAGTTPTITVNNTSDTIAAVLAGTSGLTKAGTGILTLSAANTYTGGTAITAGTLRLNGTGNLGATNASVSVNAGAVLDLNGTNQSITFVAGTGVGTVANNSGSGTSTLTLTGTAPINGSFVTIADSTTNPGGKVAVVITANTQPMSNLNTYSGGTTVNSGAFLYLSSGIPSGAGTGTINLTANGGTGANSSGLVVDGTTYANDISGAGYVHLNNASGSSTASFSGNLNTSGQWLFRNGGTNSYNFSGNGTTSVLSGIIGSTTNFVNTPTAAGSIIKSGTGTLTLSGANVYTGGTTLSAGTLIARNNTAFGTVAGTLALNGGTLDLQTIGTAYPTTVGGNVTVLSNNAASGAGTTKTLGTLSIGAFQLSVGPGTNATGSTAAITFGNATLTGNAVFNTAANSSVNLNGTVTGAFSLTVTGSGNLVFGSSTAGAIASSGGLIINSGANASITNNNQITGTIPLTVNGTLTNGAGQIFGVLNGSGTINQSSNFLYTNSPSNGIFSGVINGNGAYIKANTGLQVLSGLSGYTGSANGSTPSTLIQAGTLSINTIGNVNGGSSAIGNPFNAAAGVIAIGNAGTTGTLLFTGAVSSTDRQIQIGANSATPVVGDTGGATIQNDGTGALTFSAATFNAQTNAASGTSPTRTLTLQGSNGGTISGIIRNNQIAGASTAAVALTKAGTGTWILGGANTYTGATTVNGGNLTVAFGSGGSLSASTALTLGGGTLQFTGTGTQTVNGLTTTANTASRILLGANETLTLGALTAGAGSALNFNTLAGGANGGTVGTGIITTTSGTIPNSFTVTDFTGFGLAERNGSNQIVRSTTTALLPASASVVTTDYRIDNNGGGPTADGSSNLIITASQSAKSITVDTTATSGTLNLAASQTLSNNLWNFGGAGTNTYQITGGAGISSVASNDTITINNYNTSAVTFTSPIVAFGANPVIINGTGTTVFAGTNTYTGATTVNGSSLTLDTTGVIGSGGGSAITVNAGGTLTNNSTVATTGGITGTSTLTVANGAIAILNRASNYSGSTNVSGTLQLGNAGALGSSTLTLNSGANLQLRNDANTTFTVPFATPGTGVGVTYNFDVNNAGSAVTGRTLTLGNITFGSASTNTINVTGGNSYGLALGTLSAPSGSGISWVFNVNATTAPVTIAKFSAGSFGSALQLTGGNTITLNNFEMGANGPNSLTVSGTGTVVNLGAASQTNNRAGGTAVFNINSGTLNINNALSISNPRLSGGPIAATFNINGGTIDNTSGAAITQTANPIQNWNGNFTFAGTNALDLGTGAVTTNGPRTVTVAANTLTVGGSYTPSTIPGSHLTKLGNGTLVLNGAVALGDNGIIVNGGTVRFGGTLTTNFGTGGGGNTFRVGNLPNASAAFVQTGGSITLSVNDVDGMNIGNATSASGAFGSLTIQSGSFTAPRINVGGSGVSSGTNGVGILTVLNGATAKFNNFFIGGRSATNTGSTTIAGGTIDLTSLSGDTGAWGGGRFEVNLGANLGGSNTGGNINAGTKTYKIVASSASGQGITNLLGGTLTANQVTTLNATSTGIGQLNFNGGTLKYGGSTANASFLNAIAVGTAGTSGAFVRSGGANIDDNGQAITIAANLLAPTGGEVTGISATGSGFFTAPYVRIVGGNNDATAVAQIDASGNITGIIVTNPGSGYSTAPTVTLVGGTTAGGTNITTGTATATVGASTSGGLTKTGIGTLTLSGANTYTGTTTVNNGTLQVSGGSAIRNTGLVSLANTSGVTFQVSGSETIGALSGGGASGGAVSIDSAQTLSLSSGTQTFAGTVSGAGALANTGAIQTISGALSHSGGVNVTGGVLTLSSNSNTYTGGTTVNGGTLFVNGSISGSTSVNSGTLGGTGTVGAVTVSGGILAPGTSIETLASGVLTMNTGSTFAVELDSSVATSAGADLMKVSGDFSLSGTVTLTLDDIATSDVAFTQGTTFSLLNYTGAWNNGFFTVGGNQIPDGQSFVLGLNEWQINYAAAEGGLNFAGEYAGGSDSFVNITAVPEPGSALMLIGGLATLLGFRRRRH